MVITKMKRRARQLLCYASMLSLVFSMPGTIYAQDQEVKVKQIEGNLGHVVAMKTDGTVWGWGANKSNLFGNTIITEISSSEPIQIEDIEQVTAVATGRWHTVALKGDGTVWTWGNNWYGQLGDGRILSSSKPVQVKGLN